MLKNLDKISLEELWRRGTVPPVSALSGDYTVRMLTGPLPDLRRIKHRKRIRHGCGYNVMLRACKWGYFEVWPQTDHLLLCYYGQLQIRDQVRLIQGGNYIGRFCVHAGDKPRFLGWFLLILNGI